MAFSKQNLVSLIKVATQNGASDIHIRTGEVPSLRIQGELVPIQTKAFSPEDVSDIAKIILHKKDLRENLSSINELDGGFAVPGLCRIRYNLFHYNRKLGMIFRLINDNIPTLAELGLPKALSGISKQKRGLILVTGPTGSGKSTTLAAMIDQVNESRKAHVVTIEDPIEYLHPQKTARITQREIGRDTDNYSDALRAALRQDPDVILVGEMRDPETISIALKASETGHAVFSTVHTTDVISTVGRIISMFPPEEQGEIRKRLAVNLHAVISQRMLKRIGGGIAIAQEIMVTSPGVRECIRGDEPLERLLQIMRDHSGKSGNGCQTFDQHLMALYQNGIISKKTALEAASSQADFITKLELD